MDTQRKTRIQLLSVGLGVGLLNGLLGTGGGILAVDLLKRLGLEVKRAHATALLVTLPLSAVSALLYLWNGHGSLSQAWVYLPGGIVGAVLGAVLMNRIPDFWLRKAFAALLIYAGIRMWMR